MRELEFFPVRALGRSFEIAIHPEGETVSEIIRARGCYSRNDLTVLARFLPEGGVFIDVGANIGWHTLVGSFLVGPKGRVFAFEPDSENYRLLGGGLSRNGVTNVEAIRLAVSAKEGELPLAKDLENSGNHALRVSARAESRLRAENVPVVSLDGYFGTELYRLDFVKIDAQGAEPGILAGMAEKIQKFRPVMMVEFSPRHIRECGDSPYDFLGWIDRSTYVPFRILEDNLRSDARVYEFVPETRLLEYQVELSGTGLGIDLLFVPQERLADSGILKLLDFNVLDLVARTLYEKGVAEKAIPVCEEMLSLAPNNAGSKTNFAACLAAAGRVDRAAELLGEALAQTPTASGARVECAKLLRNLGEFERARALLEGGRQYAPQGSPDRNLIEHHLGWYELRDGNFFDGIRMDRLGRTLVKWGGQSSEAPWTSLAESSPLEGKTILVHGEGGVGDEFIHARFARILNERGARVVWETSKPIRTLLARAPGIAEVISPAASGVHGIDYRAPAADLVTLLGIGQEDLPREPYLFADPVALARWRSRLAESANLRVGIRWAGSRGTDVALARGVGFKDLGPLFEIPGISWFSLQTDEACEAKGLGAEIQDWGADLKSWEDTAGAIGALDLVITTCTSVAHLAGAMGKPVWLLAVPGCFYTWAGKTDVSIWYPSARVFRQPRFDRWDFPVAAVRAELKAWAERTLG